MKIFQILKFGGKQTTWNNIMNTVACTQKQLWQKPCTWGKLYWESSWNLYIETLIDYRNQTTLCWGTNMCVFPFPHLSLREKVLQLYFVIRYMAFFLPRLKILLCNVNKIGFLYPPCDSNLNLRVLPWFLLHPCTKLHEDWALFLEWTNDGAQLNNISDTIQLH